MTRNRLRACAIAAGLAAALLGGFGAAAADDTVAARTLMLDIIQYHMRDAATAVGRDHLAPDVLEAMRAVPRHAFVSASQRDEAYDDRPLPIGYGQTISQPFIVAIMTDLLRVRPSDVVLEIGTGSGYQAAVLARLARQVYSIEIVPELEASAAERLRRLDYGNVSVRQGDGYYGWPEAGPFDGIVVTASASHIPPPLIRQLKPGGRMIIPVGGPFALQYLILVEVDAERKVRTRQLLPVRFVPLTGQH